MTNDSLDSNQSHNHNLHKPNHNNNYKCKYMVTGGNGLIGSAIQSIVKKTDSEEAEWIFLSSADGDLRNRDQTIEIFEKYKPEFVIHLAAKVGGLFKNMSEKLEFFRENMAINDNVVQCCHSFGVKKCICCLSTCIFPDTTSYPIDETMIHLGPPHHSNEGYAYAKRMLDILTKLYNERYPNGCKFIPVIPTNIFGPNDNFDLNSGHVIPNLINKAHESKTLSVPLVVFGSGKPKRQFIYSLDLAKLIVLVLNNYQSTDPIILSVGEDQEISISDAVNVISKVAELNQPIVYDLTKADGQFKKTANNSKLINWLRTEKIDFEFTPFDEAISKTWEWFQMNKIDSI